MNLQDSISDTLLGSITRRWGNATYLSGLFIIYYSLGLYFSTVMLLCLYFVILKNNFGLSFEWMEWQSCPKFLIIMRKSIFYDIVNWYNLFSVYFMTLFEKVVLKQVIFWKNKFKYNKIPTYSIQSTPSRAKEEGGWLLLTFQKSSIPFAFFVKKYI